MKRYTKICLMIAGICLGVGLVCFSISAILGGLRGENVWAAIKEGNYSWGIGTDWGEEEIFRVDDRNIEKLEVEVGIGELSIESYSGDTYEVSYPEKYVKCSQEGNRLHIKSKKKFHWLFFSFGEKGNPKITVRVPEGSRLKEAVVSTGASKAEIKHLEAETIYLDTGAGELRANALIGKKEVTVDAGVGETHIENLQAGEAELSVGVGELYVGGSVSGDISADCGVGEINLELDNRETDFNYDISCGVGEISINGKDYSGLGNSHTAQHDAEQDFEISCGVGEVTIRLKED